MLQLTAVADIYAFDILAYEGKNPYVSTIAAQTGTSTTGS